MGKGGRLFGEQVPSADPTSFQIDNTSQEYYNSPYYAAHKNQVQPIPPPRIKPPRMDLADILDDKTIQSIQSAKKITFHAVGDTGATSPSHLKDEELVADMMVSDVKAGGPSAPAFFFHLGDVVYNFGEDKYYYDQFYDPYRNYDRPIFAIPGNHDGVTFGPTPTSEQVPTLQAFLLNFCAAKPGPSPDAPTLVRSVMTQPGVYFTLDAPMVSIIGLYSNVLEGPGVISSQGKHYPISDEQLTFLEEELKRLKPSRMAGERAVIIAIHHPPVSVDIKHGGSTGASQDIDTCCKNVGLYPDAVLSGHAHLYQRFTRRINGKEIPYVVSGSGGYNAKAGSGMNVKAGATSGDVTLETNPVINYGYLTVTVDMTSATKQMTIAFHAIDNQKDQVTVDLSQHKIIKTKNSQLKLSARKPSQHKIIKTKNSPKPSKSKPKRRSGKVR